MTSEKSPRDIINETVERLNNRATDESIRRETQGEYVETFLDREGAGLRYYIDADGVRVYLGPDEQPPKKGDVS